MNKMKEWAIIGLVALVAIAIASRVPAIGSIVFGSKS